MELDRTDGQVKLSILLTACNSKMCTEMEGLMMVAVSDTLTENWGVCWKLYFSSVKIPSGFWPSLNCCQRSVIQACSVPCLAFLSGCKHTCKVGNDKAWPTAVPRFLPPGSTRACLNQEQASCLEINQTCRMSLFSPVCLVSMLVFPHSLPSAAGMLLL